MLSDNPLSLDYKQRYAERVSELASELGAMKNAGPHSFLRMADSGDKSKTEHLLSKAAQVSFAMSVLNLF